MVVPAFCLALTWAAHLVLCFLPDGVVLALLLGRSSGWIWGLILAAILPQIYLIPWALRHSGSHVSGRAARTLWRIGFLLLGFVAVTLYLCSRGVRHRADPQLQ